MNKFLKFWVLIICLLFIFLILFTDKVNAETITSGVNISEIVATSNISEVNVPGAPFKNKGEGQVIFTFNVEGHYKLFQTTIYVNGAYYTCNLGSVQGYSDSTQQNETFTAICNVPSINGNGVQKVNFNGYSWGSQHWFNISKQWTFTDFGNPQSDYTSVLNSIKQFTEDIRFNTLNEHNDMTNLQNQLITQVDRILLQTNNNNTALTTAINNQSTQQHNDAQQQYNYISNTTISNENYTNTQTISDNNTNTQTKSVVMNFWLIPLNFFNSIIASFENTCTQVCVGECSNGSGGAHDNAWRFVFPCLDIKGFVGNTIYNTIDAFFAIGMIFAFVKRAKNFFINALMLTNDVASEVSVF